MRYRLVFHGRKRDALGISGFQVVDVEADSEQAARLKAYDTHEHIDGGLERIVVKPAPFYAGQPVRVHADLGHAMGKQWLKGYAFVRYEPLPASPFRANAPQHAEAPARAAYEATCIVRHTSGTFDGVEVRYRVTEVRSEDDPQV